MFKGYISDLQIIQFKTYFVKSGTMYIPDHQAEIRNSSTCTCRPNSKTSDSAHMGMLPGTFFSCVGG